MPGTGLAANPVPGTGLAAKQLIPVPGTGLAANLMSGMAWAANPQQTQT